jgi:dihydropteroate synthase
MGILNATPDSFSDGGQLETDAGRDTRIRAMLGAGTDILDVGGESTRPGHAQVPADEEWRRIEPVLATLRAISRDVVVSVDTRKAEVARKALAAGADFVNDVSGLGDPGMAAAVRDAGCSIVLMRHDDLVQGDVAAACRAEWARLVAAARHAGIPREAVILDPGLGFGNPPGADPAASLALIRQCSRDGSGRPVLVGASRKRFIGKLSGIEPAAGRVAGSVAAALLAAQSGAAIVRVHDVAETVQALRVWNAA